MLHYLNMNCYTTICVKSAMVLFACQMGTPLAAQARHILGIHAQSGDVIDGVRAESFFSPLINDQGQLLYGIVFNGGTDTALVRDNQVIARTDLPFLGEELDSIVPLALNNSGEILFLGAETAGTRSSLYSETQQVVSAGELIQSRYIIGEVVTADLNEAGDVAYQAAVSALQCTQFPQFPCGGEILVVNGQVVWAEIQSMISPGPNLTEYIDLNNAGDLLFGRNNALGPAVASVGDILRTPASIQSTAPISAGNIVVQAFGQAVHNDSGTTATEAYTVIPFIFSVPTSIISNSNLLVTPGQQVCGSTISTATDPVIDSSGDIVFFAGLQTASGTQESLIFYCADTSSFSRIASTTVSPPFGLPPIPPPVAESTTSAIGGRFLVGIGGPSNLLLIGEATNWHNVNDCGDTAFTAFLDDGTSALIVATRTDSRAAGYVKWPNGVGIAGVEIEPYYFTGTESQWTIQPLPLLSPNEPTITEADGSFSLPPELDPSVVPVQMGEIDSSRRGLRARLSYSEDTGLAQPNSRTVVNYPDNDPARPFRSLTRMPMNITYPYPVLFVPGVMGQINGDIDDSDGRLQAFLTLDAGANYQEILALANYDLALAAEFTKWQSIKRSRGAGTSSGPLPAFVYFGMPSNTSLCGQLLGSDRVSWGYDNCFHQSDMLVFESAKAIDAHVRGAIRQELLNHSPVDPMPIHVIGHSLGGLITRNWLSGRGYSYPVERYITLDSPHGGIWWARDFWSLFHLNGAAQTLGMPATTLGWNHGRNLRTQRRLETNLLFAADSVSTSPTSLLVSPLESAFSIGKVTWSPLGTLGSSIVSNGYCERFIDAWQLTAPGETHSLQEAPQILASIAGFLTGSTQPWLGSRSNPMSPQAFAARGNKNSCIALDGSAITPPAFWSGLLSATGGGATSFKQLSFDAAQVLTVTALVTRDDAQLDVLNGGAVIPPLAVTITPFGASGHVLESSVAVSMGAGAVRLTSGVADVAADVAIQFSTDWSTSTAAYALGNTPGTQVTITAHIQDSLGTVLVGLGATKAQLRLTLPDQTELTSPMFDDGLNGDGAAGDGVYGTLVNNTAQSGRYSFSTELAIVSGTAIVHRFGDGGFVISSDAAMLLGLQSETTLDLSPRPGAEALGLTFDVSVNTPGSFLLVADVADQNGIVVDRLSEGLDVSATPSLAAITLRVPSELFHELGGTGPLTIDNILLLDDTQALVLSTLPAFQTQNYSLASFAPPLAPAIGSVTPSFGENIGGRPILIQGDRLGQVTEVWFDQSRAPSFTIIDDRSLLATLPAWHGKNATIPVRVVTPWSESTRAGLFTYSVSVLPVAEPRRRR